MLANALAVTVARADSVRFAADAEGVDLAGRSPVGDGFADLEHMGAEDHVVAGFEVVCVVFHERITAGQAAAQCFHGADECGSFPVAFAAEAESCGH